MKWVELVSRLLLGGVMVVFGINGFVSFLPLPPMEGPAGEMMGLLFASGWIYVVKALELVGGALVLAGWRLPLGLTLLGPVLVNILLFHVLLEPTGLPIGIVLTIAWFVLFGRNRDAFAGILGTAQ